MRASRLAVRVVVAGAMVWAGACHDDQPLGAEPADTTATDPCPSCPTSLPSGLILSSLVREVAPAAGARAGVDRAGRSLGEVVYVSLAPGTVPTGTRAVVRRAGDPALITTSVLGGGFDPVPITAQNGDSIEVTVTDATDSLVFHAGDLVVLTRRPVVVRTDPPPRKRDVPLNARIVVVFSAPIAPATVSTSSLQLWRGTTPVVGTVGLTDRAGLQAQFVPDSPLAETADYQLVVTQSIRDVNGLALASPITVPFTTGTTTTGALASLTVAPESALVQYGEQYWFYAVGRDAAGNVVAIAPTWSVVAGGGTIFTPQGFTQDYALFTPTEPGIFTNTVRATAGGVSGYATVVVGAGALARISVTPDSIELPINGTMLFTAFGADSNGDAVPISPTWSVVAGGGTIDTVIQGAALFTAGRSGGTFANTVRATSGGISGYATVVVTAPESLASIAISPAMVTLPVNGTQQFTAIGRDYTGRVVAVSPSWSVAGGGTISSTGLFTAGTEPGIYWWTVVASSGRVGSNAATVAVTDPAAGLVFAAVTAGGQHSCGVTTSGAARCWGDNSHGALGTGTTVSSSVPVPVTGGLIFYLLSAGGTHTCGTTPFSGSGDGYVTYCWGGNAKGQLGDGTTLNRLGPQAIDSGAMQGAIISAGLSHTCLLDLWAYVGGHCWGANDRGQLDDGTTISRTSPVPIRANGPYHFEAVTAGGSHTCAEAGGAEFPSFVWYCWGANDQGQLGDGTTTDRTQFVLVGDGMSFEYHGVSAGAQHTCGVTAARTAYCWGDNSSGQLGDGTTTDRTRPTLVAGGLNFLAVSAGSSHTCGLTAAGAAYCWGANDHGQLGDGTTTQRLTPVPVAGGLSFALMGNIPHAVTLGAGSSHTCAVTVSGAVYCWGANGSGQLGNGTTTDSAVPVRVAGSP